MTSGDDEIGIAGFMYYDYYPNNGLTFEDVYNRYKFLFDKTKDTKSTKISIDPALISGFNHMMHTFIPLCSNRSGGGGENARKAFDILKQKYAYFDSCKRPNMYNSEISAYFAEVCPHCNALVLQKSKDNSESISVKNSRGDMDGRELPDEFRGNLEAYLKKGHDFCPNSISNEDFAEIIAKNAQGRLYTLVTKYLDRKGEALEGLINRSDGLFFSLKEFYWLFKGDENAGDRWKYESAGDDFVEFRRDLEKEHELIGDDIVEFARDLGGFVSVSLGEQGVILYDKKYGKRPFLVRLDNEPWEYLQKHIAIKKISTNTSGDNLYAAMIYARKIGMSLEEAAKFASKFVVNNVLQYKDAKEKDFVVKEV